MSEPVIALVGSESLLGREILDHLNESSLAAGVRLVASGEEESGRLMEAGGEVAVVAKLNPEAFEGASCIVLAGSAESAHRVEALHLKTSIIDVKAELEDAPNARLRAPLIEPHDFRVAPDALQVIAHPAAIALTIMLSRVHQVFPIARSLAHIFEPASERGTPGIEELQAQTVNLLSFKPLPKKVFDAQLSYSMLARFGDEAPVSLADIEARIERHLATLLALTGAPMPSLRLLQAPVFHGYSFSIWLEFEQNPGMAALGQVLNEPPIDFRGAGMEPPNNVGVAGQRGVAVGDMTIDRNHPQAVWFWMAADNLRLSAENAAAVIREVV